MTVVLSILFAAVVGGVLFMLIDRWGRESAPSSSAEATRELWTPAASPRPAASSLFVPPSAHAPVEERTEPLPSSRGLWDDPPRRDEDDEDRRPPGLWSGWAR
jgi:hypothetical protein